MDRIDDQKDWGENIKKKKNCNLSYLLYVLFKFFFWKKIIIKKENVIIQKQNELWDREQSE